MAKTGAASLLILESNTSDDGQRTRPIRANGCVEEKRATRGAESPTGAGGRRGRSRSRLRRWDNSRARTTSDGPLHSCKMLEAHDED